MSPEQQAAFINAQCALVNAKIAGMTAENNRAYMKGEEQPYREADFERESQPGILGWNAVITFFQGQ